MPWDIAPAADLVTQPFGCVDYIGEWPCPGCGSGHFHAGIDLGSSAGGQSIFRSPVVATRTGTVSAIGIQYLGDQAVAVKVDGGPTIEHGHLDQALVAVGQRVNPGDVLGLLGTKGASTAPHLHIEVRVDGPFQGVNGCPELDPTRDPEPYLNKARSMHAGLDSSTFRPSPDQLRRAKADGVAVWGGYLATKSGVELYSPWDLASFDVVRELPGKPIAYCSGWDDPVACAALARDWDVLPVLDVEDGIRSDGPWVQSWIDDAGRGSTGLYGNGRVFAGRTAACYIVAGYPGYDPAQSWGYVARPNGPCGWQWRGSADEYGGSTDRCWFDGWFVGGGAAAPPEEESMIWLIQGDQKPEVYVTNSLARRWIANYGEFERWMKRIKKPLEKWPQYDVDRIPRSWRNPEDLTGTGLKTYDDIVFGPPPMTAAQTAILRPGWDESIDGPLPTHQVPQSIPEDAWAPTDEEVEKLHAELGFYPVVGAPHKA